MTEKRSAPFARAVACGVLLGLAGGIAEVIWIALYGSAMALDTSTVALAIGTTAGRAVPALALAAAPVLSGILIHMIAAVGLGVMLALVWRQLAAQRSLRIDEFTFMLGALTLVWTFNFFVVLPLVSPAFVDLHGTFVELLPYPVSLASKLLFGLAGALVLRLGRRAEPVPVRVLAR